MEKKKTKTNAQKLAEKAKELAYSDSTKKADYPNGKPKDEYKKALNKAYPDRRKWGTAPRKGASCDVFIGTVNRASGVDKKFPRSLNTQYDYLEKSKKYKRVRKPTVKKLQDGDIIIFKKKNGKGHICMIVDGKVKQASYENYYPRTNKNVRSMLKTRGRKFVRVYRAR